MITDHEYKQRPFSSGDVCKYCQRPAAEHGLSEREQVVNLLRKLAKECPASTSGYEAALNALGESV